MCAAARCDVCSAALSSVWAGGKPVTQACSTVSAGPKEHMRRQPADVAASASGRTDRLRACTQPQARAMVQCNAEDVPLLQQPCAAWRALGLTPAPDTCQLDILLLRAPQHCRARGVPAVAASRQGNPAAVSGAPSAQCRAAAGQGLWGSCASAKSFGQHFDLLVKRLGCDACGGCVKGVEHHLQAIKHQAQGGRWLEHGSTIAGCCPARLAPVSAVSAVPACPASLQQLTRRYSSCTSVKKVRMASSFLPSCSSKKRALPGVTYAVTNRLLNLSTVCSSRVWADRVCRACLNQPGSWTAAAIVHHSASLRQGMLLTHRTFKCSSFEDHMASSTASRDAWSTNWCRYWVCCCETKQLGSVFSADQIFRSAARLHPHLLWPRKVHLIDGLIPSTNYDERQHASRDSCHFFRPWLCCCDSATRGSCAVSALRV